LELKHLRYFVTLAEEMHFGRAAARLHISQPPLSQMVRRLEGELGVALFRRSSRNVELTEPGRLFLEEARRTLSHAAHSVRVARQAHGGAVGSLELGFVPACGVFPAAVRRFARRFPRVKVALRHMSSAEQLSSVARGALDAGFVHLPVSRDGLVVEEVQRNALLIALPTGHALASRRSITWRALNGQRFVGFPRASAPEAHDALMARLRQAGFHPEVVFETDSLLARLRIVAAGIGVSLVPDYAAELPRAGVVLRPLPGPAPRVGIGVVHSAARVTPALASFLAVVREVKARPPRGGVRGRVRAKRNLRGSPRRRRAARGAGSAS
jgi:DNA-binding transcriptional LysR family regulator